VGAACIVSTRPNFLIFHVHSDLFCWMRTTTARHKIRLCADNWEPSGLKRVWKVRTLNIGKTGLSPSLIAENFPGTVLDFTACSLPPPSAFTFDLLPKSDGIVLFYFIYLHVSKSLFIYLPLLQTTFYVPHPRTKLLWRHFIKKRCYRPYLCLYHTSLSVFRTFSLPPSVTETTFTLPQFGQIGLL
jgi:hypothetical protein